MTTKETPPLPESIDIVIIGAGAAGLMCASIAGQRGRNVLLIDHANKVGKKILMSGGGRCNFTNIHTRSDNFISNNPNFCKSALSRYTPNDFIDLVKKHDIPYHEKKLGQLFCDNKAKDILNMLIEECQQVNVKIRAKCTIEKIEFHNDRYLLSTTFGSCECNSLVIATGGLSIPSMGASGFGYQIAKQFNINVTPTRAALVPFTINQHILDQLSKLSGSSVEASVSYKNISFDENILFTHRGISGPAILQISSYWESGEVVEVNLLPKINLLKVLKENKTQGVKLTLKNLLGKFLSRNIANILLDLWFANSELNDKPINQLADSDIEKISYQFHHWKFKPNGTEGYRTAEVTLGGVDCHEISSKTMEANKQKGLYFIGEVLDVTGHLGGYNFQWAWASAVAAGRAV